MDSYHFIGIGGIGMSALARILLKRGASVQGSDLASTYVTESLKNAGVQVFSHHNPSHLPSHCITVYGSAIKPDHPEYAAAMEKQFPLLHRSDLLAQLMQGYQTLLVTGTHGKTTTSCLLAHVLQTAGCEPTFALGGVALNFTSNGDHGKGNYFVAEADESDGSFLKYPSLGAIITNIGEEHLDYWKTKNALIEGFRQFAARVPSLLWWCADDPILSSLKLHGQSYGESAAADLRITRWSQHQFSLDFDVAYKGQNYLHLQLPLLGHHNILNSAAVLGLSLDLGISESLIRQAFASFQGVKRRLEKKGEKKGILFLDDYAHHPTEIKTTLRGLRKAVGEKRLISIFQPHRYTRLSSCWKEFLTAFEETDVLFITDIWSAGETPIQDIEIGKLTKEIQERIPIPVIYGSRSSLSKAITQFLRPHDVVITLGAGDITDLCNELLQEEFSPYRVAICQGGKSAEHEVALSSASVITQAMDLSYYIFQQFTITKQGEWAVDGIIKTLPEIVAELLTYDLVFPVFHGPFGEDGTIQGFFETLGLPYVGPDFRAAAVAMDKAWTKHIAAAHGVEVARFQEFAIYAWEQEPEALLHHIIKNFSFPFYIKAVHLGSTFGVFRVKNVQEVHRALTEMRKLDYRFLVEEEVQGRELEFGFIGNYDVQVADPAEVIRSEEVHTYENKYSAKGLPSIPKAPLPPHILAKGREIATTVYKAVGCTGLARIDFFLKPEGTWVLNEVNPIPGCTPTSVYPLIWQAEGVPMNALIDRLIIAGLHRHRYCNRRLRPPPKPPVFS